MTVHEKRAAVRMAQEVLGPAAVGSRKGAMEVRDWKL